MAFIAALAEQLPFVGALRSAVAAYALVNAVHILCLGLLMGSILPLDLGIVGVPGFGWAAMQRGHCGERRSRALPGWR